MEVRVKDVTHLAETGQAVIIGDLLQLVDDELETCLLYTSDAADE